VTAHYQASWASGRTIQFRLLTWKEYRYATSLTVTAAERDLWIYERVVIDGPATSDITAGVVRWLGQYLVDSSPFSETVDSVKKFRNLTQQWFESSYLEQARALIAGTFHVPFEAIDDWDHETFFKRLIAAEMLVGKRMEPVTQENQGQAVQDAASERQKQREAQKQAVRKDLRDRVERRRLPAR
jgi:hypothetical protein